MRYINPFLGAVRLVLGTAAKMSNVTMGDPHLKDLRKDLSRVYCLTVYVPLSGRTEGAVSIRFTRAVAFGLYKALTTVTPRTVDANVIDAVQELASMIVGNAKAKFPELGTSIGAPRVVRADPLTVQPVLVLPFDCGHGRFLIETKLAAAGAAGTAAPPTTTSPPARAAA
ncbi:MAG TPA: chemotaxis protein CheX [Humisphaera sp.]